MTSELHLQHLRPIIWLFGIWSVSLLAEPGRAEGWQRFRGPNGTGVVADGDPLPLIWSNERGIRWKTAVPRGASSPILVSASFASIAA